MSSVFGDIGNFLFGNGNKSKSTSNSTTDSSSTSHLTTTSNPYAGVQQNLDAYIQSLNGTYGPNATTPQISPLEQSGYDATAATAGQSGANLNPAITENNKTISGQYLTPDTNPYLKAVGEQVAGQAAATANGTFGGAGRTGSGLSQYYVGKGTGDALATLYGGEYDKERQLQEGAVASAPGLNNATYQAPQALISAGQNVSARPYDISAQYGGILNNIARLGGTTTADGTQTGTSTSTGTTTGQAASNGLVGNAITSFTNKLFS